MTQISTGSSYGRGSSGVHSSPRDVLVGLAKLAAFPVVCVVGYALVTSIFFPACAVAFHLIAAAFSTTAFAGALGVNLALDVGLGAAVGLLLGLFRVVFRPL